MTEAKKSTKKQLSSLIISEIKEDTKEEAKDWERWRTFYHKNIRRNKVLFHMSKYLPTRNVLNNNTVHTQGAGYIAKIIIEEVRAFSNGQFLEI